MTLEKLGQRYAKKKAISAADYIELEQTKLPEQKTLTGTRICTLDDDLYIIIDYYPEIDGQPMICIIQINEENHQKAGGGRIKLPDYIQIEKEITDVPQYSPITMSQVNYKAVDYEEKKDETKWIIVKLFICQLMKE